MRSCAWRRTRCSPGTRPCRPEDGPGGRRSRRRTIQTDRDVGAASIGEGLLAAYGVTRDSRYLSAAKAAGDFLLGVAEPDSGGLRWPDWADPDGQRSTTHYTSFDDGAAGISDYLLQLSSVTGESRFRTAALGGMRWLVAQAVGPSCPQTECSWKWTDDPSDEVAYNGVGMGEAGIVLALDTFADATGDRTFRDYARAGAARLRALTRDGRRPLPQGSEHPEVFETGFLNGSAGAAFMFLERYAHDHARVDLETAKRLLGWVNDQAEADGRGGLRWPLAVGDAAAASGFELGAAGIAWVNLRAAQATGDRSYREVARRAGVWLRHVATAGSAWSELPGDLDAPVHVGLDSGAAGIGWVLEDLADAGIDTAANRAAAWSALGRAAIRRRARQPRHVLVREPDRWKAGSARRAVVALGLRGNRSVCGSPPRVVRTKPGRTAHRLSPRRLT